MKKFEPLREDSRFQSILKDMNLSQCVLPQIDLNRILAKLSLANLSLAWLPLEKPHLQILQALQILKILQVLQILQIRPHHRPPIYYCGIATA